MNEFRFHPNLLMRLQTFQNMPLKNENIPNWRSCWAEAAQGLIAAAAEEIQRLECHIRDETKIQAIKAMLTAKEELL